jgi:hypothetical protein
MEDTAESDCETIEIDAAVTIDWLTSVEEMPATEELVVEIAAEVTADWLASDEEMPDTDELTVDRAVDTSVDCDATALE